MVLFSESEWSAVFVPDASLLVSFVRGSVVYLSLLVLFRFVMRRQMGSIGLPDIMLVVLVSECVSAALSAESKSVPNGLAAVSALLFWSFALDRAGHRWPRVQRLLQPVPLTLVRDGKPLRENMNSEGVTDDELTAQLRLNGIDDVARVKLATLETDGNLSVIPRSGEEAPDDSVPAPAAADPPDLDAAVERFVETATALQAAIDWHEARAADHTTAAKMARDLLARHGVRTRKPARPASTTPTETPR